MKTGTLTETFHCSGCDEDKSRDEFYWRSSGKRDHLCKACRKIRSREDERRWRAQNPEAAKARDARYSKQFRERNPDYTRNAWLVRTYSITLEQYTAMLEAQGGVCLICQSDDPKAHKGESFCVDHDHECCPGKKSCGECVRGLLCMVCNINLRALEHWSEEELARAKEYLQR